VPIVIVDELDGLKRNDKDHTRWRAGYTLAVLDRLFASTGGNGFAVSLRVSSSTSLTWLDALVIIVGSLLFRRGYVTVRFQAWRMQTFRRWCERGAWSPISAGRRRLLLLLSSLLLADAAPWAGFGGATCQHDGHQE
jgi:hypothetical protein